MRHSMLIGWLVAVAIALLFALAASNGFAVTKEPGYWPYPHPYHSKFLPPRPRELSGIIAPKIDPPDGARPASTQLNLDRDLSVIRAAALASIPFAVLNLIDDRAWNIIEVIGNLLARFG